MHLFQRTKNSMKKHIQALHIGLIGWKYIADKFMSFDFWSHQQSETPEMEVEKLAFDTDAIAQKISDANFWQKKEGGQFFLGCAAEWRVDPVVLIWGSAANVNPRRRRQEAKLTSTTAALNTKAQPARKYKTNTKPKYKQIQNQTTNKYKDNFSIAVLCTKSKDSIAHYQQIQQIPLFHNLTILWSNSAFLQPPC